METDKMIPELIAFPVNLNEKGNLCFVEGNKNIPFKIRRVYWIFKIPEGTSRGGHAHKKLFQVLIAISGSFEVILDNGRDMIEVHMDKQDEGLLIRPGTWKEIRNFTTGAVCLVLASERFSESDYIRDYSEFKRYSGGTSDC